MSLYQMLQESGAVGGAYRGATEVVDTFPALSLLECVTALPAVLTESAIDAELEVNCENMALAEAAMMNESATFEALNENVFTNMKDRVVKYYNKAIEWVKSIIAKIKQWGNTVRMSGKKLAENYADKISKVDLKGFTFDGYKFPDDLSKQVKSGCKIADINSYIEAGLKGYNLRFGELATLGNESTYASASNAGWETSDKANDTRKKFDTALDGLKKFESDKGGFKAQVYGELAAKAVTNADKINEVLFKLFRGDKAEKSELKDGAGFSRSSLLERMKREGEIDDVLTDYTELQSAIEDAKKTLVDAIETVEGLEAPENAQAVAVEKMRNYVSARAEVIRSVNTLYQTAIGCITTVRGALTTALKDRNAQDKKLFVAMLNFKNPSAKNNSFMDDLVDGYDFEL